MMFSAVRVLGTVERRYWALSYCPISIGHAITREMVELEKTTILAKR